MAPYSYYFLFSLIGCVVVPFAIFNAKFAVSRGKSLVGEKLTPDAIGYKKIKWLASRQGLAVAFLTELFFIANLAYSIYLILNLGDRGYATSMFIFGPIATLVIFIGALNVMAKDIKKK